MPEAFYAFRFPPADRVVIVAVRVTPLSPPPSLLLRESWRHFQRCGCPAAFWEMQSFVSDRCKAMWREQHWNRVTECQQGIASLTIMLSFVCLSPSSFCQSHHSLSLLLFSLCCLSFTHQGFEKGWSDYRGTAEEDCEQPQSSRISHQEWPSASLKRKKKQTKNLTQIIKNTGDLSAVGNSNLIWWFHM